MAFGEYVQIQEHDKNSTALRTIDVIAIRLSGSAPYDHYFYSHMTMQQIDCNIWVEVPTAANVVACLNKLFESREAHQIIFCNWSSEESDLDGGGDVILLHGDRVLTGSDNKRLTDVESTVNNDGQEE